MREKIIFSLLILFFSISLSQQPFTVISSTPADGEFGVKSAPDSVLLKFVFSKHVDLTKSFPRDANIPLGPFNFLSFDPIDSVEFGAPYLGPSPNEVGGWVKLRPNTDYCVILLGAYSTDGDLLATPYVLNFTTSLVIGQRTVSGTVTVPNPRVTSVNLGKFELSFKEAKISLEKILGANNFRRDLNIKLPEFNIFRLSQSLSIPEKVTSVDPKWGVVALLDANPFAGVGILGL